MSSRRLLEASLDEWLDPVLWDRLDAKIPNRDHNLWFTLHGAVQHLLYHAGQIAMLKKAAIST